jgi:uncharacterized protein (TIGR03067 family)
MRKHLALLLTAGLSVAFAPAPLPRVDPRNAEDLKKLQGTWVLVSEREEGRPLRVANRRAVIDGTDLTYFVDGKRRGEWHFTLDARARPKAIDLRRYPPADPLLTRAVYVLEGDTLTVCINGLVPSKRPADVSGTGPLHCVEVWKRQKR